MARGPGPCLAHSEPRLFLSGTRATSGQRHNLGQCQPLQPGLLPHGPHAPPVAPTHQRFASVCLLTPPGRQSPVACSSPWGCPLMSPANLKAGPRHRFTCLVRLPEKRQRRGTEAAPGSPPRAPAGPRYCQVGPKGSRGSVSLRTAARGSEPPATNSGQALSASRGREDTGRPGLEGSRCVGQRSRLLETVLRRLKAQHSGEPCPRPASVPDVLLVSISSVRRKTPGPGFGSASSRRAGTAQPHSPEPHGHSPRPT